MGIETLYLIIHIAWATSLIPLAAYLINRRSVTKEIRIIAALIVSSLLFDGLGLASAVYFRSSALTNNIYYLLAFFFFSWFYYEILYKKHYKQIFFTGVIVFIASFLWITFFVQNFFHEAQTYGWTASEVIFIVYASVYLHHFVLTLPTNQGLYKFGLLWINGAVLFHNGFAACIHFMSDYNFKNMAPEAGMLMWGLFNISRIIQNILLAIGIYYSGRLRPLEVISKTEISLTGKDRNS